MMIEWRRTPPGLLVHVTPGHRACLVHDAYTDNAMFLYRTHLLWLHGSEEYFCDGRFVHYSDVAQAFPVTLSRSPIDGNELLHWMGERIDWLGQHAQDAWHFVVSMSHVSQITVRYSFANICTAVTFALVWKGE